MRVLLITIFVHIRGSNVYSDKSAVKENYRITGHRTVVDELLPSQTELSLKKQQSIIDQFDKMCSHAQGI